MFKFVANLNFLFGEVSFFDRFEAASKEGFKYIEFMFPYEYKTSEIKNKLESNDLELVLFNLPAGNWNDGERGIAVNPSRRKEFMDGVEKAIEIALELGVKKVNCLVGNKLPELTAEETDEILIQNLKYAANELLKNDIKLLVEPINDYDMPDFYINTTKKAMELIERVNSKNIYLQYDVYHAARKDENHKLILEKYFDRIGHIQVADSPDRHQPGTGDIKYKTIFEELGNLGYKEFISMEYKPNPNTSASLDWLSEFGFNL